MPTTQFLKLKQAAQILNVSRNTLDRIIGRGELTIHRFGRGIRIAPEDLMAYVRCRRTIKGSTNAPYHDASRAMG